MQNGICLHLHKRGRVNILSVMCHRKIYTQCFLKNYFPRKLFQLAVPFVCKVQSLNRKSGSENLLKISQQTRSVNFTSKQRCSNLRTLFGRRKNVTCLLGTFKRFLYYFLIISSGLFGIVWYILWFLVVHSTPATHPTISKKERQYIENHTVPRKVIIPRRRLAIIPFIIPSSNFIKEGITYRTELSRSLF